MGQLTSQYLYITNKTCEGKQEENFDIQFLLGNLISFYVPLSSMPSVGVDPFLSGHPAKK